ncbi:hypothetical protein Tco_1227172 [Tanacetum coccineum]
MNPQEIQQVTTCDEKWVPSAERVKISSTNVRLETTVPQKEETFQVIIDVIKNSTCFKAFTISADIPEIFMQQFWYTIKKVQDTYSYECILANKRCVVDVFRMILDICPRVEGEDFTEVQDDDVALTFLIDLGYKASNDKLRKSRIDILWGMFYKENIDYPELIWEDDDGIVSRLKFVRIGEDYQEYGLPIPETMLTEAIKQSKSYQMFIKYSTGRIPPKKSRDKGSQGKKIADTHVADDDVSEESDTEPANQKTASRRVVKKKVTVTAADNIILDPDVALELEILGCEECLVSRNYWIGHLEEIVVKRADRQLYKFKEVVDFMWALHMFTRSLVIKKCVEDLQLGVESYQKKFNITAPQKTFPEIDFKELYTPSYDPL